MKIIIALLTATLITGCSLLTPAYDNNEYELLAKLETSVRLAQEHCSNEEVLLKYLPMVVMDAELLTTYSFYIPRNTEVYETAVILRDDVREFEAQYRQGKGNKLYCELKTKLFLKKVRAVLEVVGQKHG